MRLIDLRSDTVTTPPRDMLETIQTARLGDDVYGEDETVNHLEEMAAERFDKESALLVTSGTQANTVALLAQTKPGDAVIMESECHIYHYELGNFSTLGGLIPRLVEGRLGCPDPEEIERMMQREEEYRSGTRLICLENTHNRAGGTIILPSKLRAIQDVAARHNISVYLDGARIFNAAIATGLNVKEFSHCTNNMMFCLSKGLSAPVGSVLLGDKEFISKARRIRKMLGGGMRKAGVIAAPGIYALDHMVERLKEDHENARMIAEGLRKIPGIELDMETVQTNMVRFGVNGMGLSVYGFIEEMEKKGVRVSDSGHFVRMVTHYGITKEDIQFTIDATNDLGAQRQRLGNGIT